MKPATDLDELFAQQAKACVMLQDDPSPQRIQQTRELNKRAGQLIGIVKTKLAACRRAGVLVEIPELGKFKGEPALRARNNSPAGEEFPRALVSAGRRAQKQIGPSC